MPDFDGDNPEWTEADFAKAKLVSEHPILAKVFRRSSAGKQGGKKDEPGKAKRET